jgi:hypothetical protein
MPGGQSQGAGIASITNANVLIHGSRGSAQPTPQCLFTDEDLVAGHRSTLGSLTELFAVPVARLVTSPTKAAAALLGRPDGIVLLT